MQQVSKNMDLSRRMIEEVWNNRNFAVIYEVLGDDFVSHDPLSGDLYGPESQEQFIRGMVAAFPDVQGEILEQSEKGSQVTTKILLAGTNTGSLGDLPATNRVATVPVTVRDRFEDGRIVESWAEWDPSDMMAQLGVKA